jgi:hypothetical protein
MDGMTRGISQGGKMKASKITVAGLILIFALSSSMVFAQATPGKTQEPKKPEPKQPQKEILPKEIKAILLEGLATRQGRNDIPFTIFKSLYFPAPDGMYSVIFFRAKNSDLGYATPLPASPPPKSQQAKTPAPATGMLEARLALAIEFFVTDETGAQKVARQVAGSVAVQTEAATYDPNKEEWYSVDVGMPYGKYTVALLLCSVDPKKGIADLKKVGVQYYDMTVPGPETYSNALETTPPFFVRNIDRLQTYEPRPIVHKSFFTYSVLHFVPNIDSIVTAEDQSKIEVFFIVLGAKPKQEPQPGQQPEYSIEVTFEVQKEDGSAAVRYLAQDYPYQLISQQLPLQQTLQIKDDKGQRQEKKDLPPGKYVLSAKVLDKVSQLKVEKKVPFEVK